MTCDAPKLAPQLLSAIYLKEANICEILIMAVNTPNRRI